MKTILITGAASGIGRALAVLSTKAGHVLYLCDQNKAGLEETGALCAKTGKEPRLTVADVGDVFAMEEWVRSCGHLDLVLICAGVQFTSLVGEPETPDQTRKTIAVNLLGALNVALPALDIMTGQVSDQNGVRGQIAILASQGAFVSVPGASAYSASKAALDNWAVGRAATARRQGVFLTSICPGYVQTPMSAINAYPMQGLMQPEKAAQIILQRLARRPVRIAFPWHMYAAARLGGLMPAGFPARMLARNYLRKMKLA